MCRTDLLELLLGLAQLGQQRLDALGQFIGAPAHKLGELVDERVFLRLELIRTVADQSVDTTHARTDGPLGQHSDAANVTGRGNVSATAELAVEPITDSDDADLGTVLFTEQCDRASFTRGIDAHDLGGHDQILGELFVH